MKFNIYKEKNLVGTIEAAEIYAAIGIADAKYGPSFDVEGDGLLVKVSEKMTSFSSFRPVNIDLREENNLDVKFDFIGNTKESVLTLGRFSINLGKEQTVKFLKTIEN